jgi:hypothetical protein
VAKSTSSRSGRVLQTLFVSSQERLRLFAEVDRSIERYLGAPFLDAVRAAAAITLPDSLFLQAGISAPRVRAMRRKLELANFLSTDPYSTVFFLLHVVYKDMVCSTVGKHAARDARRAIVAKVMRLTSPRRGRPNELPRQQVSEWLELRLQGATDAEIARRFGVKRQTVTTTLRHYSGKTVH